MDYRNSVFLMLYLPERRITQLPKCLTATSMSAPSLDPKPTMSRLSRAALLIAFFFGLEKALGFVRQVAIARTFGLSATLDVYNAANNLPDLLFASSRVARWPSLSSPCSQSTWISAAARLCGTCSRASPTWSS